MAENYYKKTFLLSFEAPNMMIVIAIVKLSSPEKKKNNFPSPGKKNRFPFLFSYQIQIFLCAQRYAWAAKSAENNKEFFTVELSFIYNLLHINSFLLSLRYSDLMENRFSLLLSFFFFPFSYFFSREATGKSFVSFFFLSARMYLKQSAFETLAKEWEGEKRKLFLLMTLSTNEMTWMRNFRDGDKLILKMVFPQTTESIFVADGSEAKRRHGA